MAQQVTAATGTTTTTYVGNLEEIVSSPSGTSTSAFYYAGSVRIAVSVNGVLSYLAADALGSTNLALNSTGSATAALLYAPYGSSRYSSGSMPTDYGFTGQHHDSVTGLDYFNARYYDSVAGQFTSADTILPGGGYDHPGPLSLRLRGGQPDRPHRPQRALPLVRREGRARGGGSGGGGPGRSRFRQAC